MKALFYYFALLAATAGWCSCKMGNGKPLPVQHIAIDSGGVRFQLVTTGIPANGQWTREVVKVSNKPADPFLLCALNADKNNELYALGFLNSKAGPKAVVYKIIK